MDSEAWTEAWAVSLVASTALIFAAAAAAVTVLYWLGRVLIVAPPAPLGRGYDLITRREGYNPAHARPSVPVAVWAGARVASALADFPSLR